MKSQKRKRDGAGATQKRSIALYNLSETLKSGKKRPKGLKFFDALEDLTDSDKERIQREIDVLKSKGASYEAGKKVLLARKKVA